MTRDGRSLFAIGTALLAALLHNVTLANGPRAIGSPNLDADRIHSQRFQNKGTYRLFCALHPVRMHERVIVTGK